MCEVSIIVRRGSILDFIVPRLTIQSHKESCGVKIFLRFTRLRQYDIVLGVFFYLVIVEVFYTLFLYIALTQ